MEDFLEAVQAVSSLSGLVMQDCLKSTTSWQIVEYHKQLCEKGLYVYK